MQVGEHLLLGMGASQQSEIQCCPHSCPTSGHPLGLCCLSRGSKACSPELIALIFSPKWSDSLPNHLCSECRADCCLARREGCGGKPTRGQAQLREAMLAAAALARWGGFSGALRTGQLVSLVCVGLGLESSASQCCRTPTSPAEPWGGCHLTL